MGIHDFVENKRTAWGCVVRELYCLTFGDVGGMNIFIKQYQDGKQGSKTAQLEQ